MKLPYLTDLGEASKKYVVSFRGLNYGEGWQDGEFAECRNLSSELYPCLTQRRERVKKGEYTSPTALHAKEKLLVVDGTSVLYNGKVVGTVTAGKKQIATVGNYIIIFPDKVYYNVSNGTFSSMEATHTSTGLVFTTSTITTTGADWPFKAGDAVEITGCTAATENNKTPIVRSVSGKVLTFYDNTFTAATEAGSVTVKRKVPDLDFICESNYRLWGTCGNTIYGSKYGDPLNFYVYDGLTSDSYFIDVASDGAFTGCIPYSSHICFFKENTLHKLYGSKPSNFQIVTSNVYGVQSGCEKSLCIVNETLYYKGVNGVYAYTGGVPELISEKFGTKRFSDAAACSDGERYYISMKHGTEWGLYVYDVLRGLWMKEDETHAIDMCFHEGSVYFIGGDGCLYQIDRTAGKNVEWMVEFTPFNETMNERKGYSKFHLRLDLEAGSWLTVEVRTDLDNKWKKVCTTHNELAKTMTVPIIPTRCDKVSVRVSGKGECLIRTFIREFRTGSDV